MGSRKKENKNAPPEQNKGEKEIENIPTNMAKPGRQNRPENRLYINKPQVQKCRTKSTKNNGVAGKHGATKTTQCNTNEHMLKTDETIQES